MMPQMKERDPGVSEIGILLQCGLMSMIYELY